MSDFMISDQLLLLVLLSFGLLIVSLIIIIKVFIELLKKNTGEYYIIFMITGIAISLLIPVFLGMVQEIL